MLESITNEVPWATVERFSSLVRESGTPEEREAFQYLMEKLDAWGVPYTLHEPVCLISLPRGAELRVLGDEDNLQEVHAKTPSFSVATGTQWVEGEVLYVPTGGFAADITQIFGAGGGVSEEVRGRIALTEGYPMPGKVADFVEAGATAAIFISPGERIHEGICTPIWGAPDLDSVGRKPAIPVLAVSRSDGERLAELAEGGVVQVALRTELDEGWKPIPVLVAEIPGKEVPEEFCLLHGHVDSWYVGVGDNAVGDALMLEVARAFWENRDRLRRTLRIAWWSGHSHGRYAGSTWYADTFALELAEYCVAQVNCDSPGCRDASAFEAVMWMDEAETVAGGTIEDVTGLSASGVRPPRAGDYSFNNLGLSAFYMLLSEIPKAEKERRGYYAVGGCGGNLEWHAEDDELPVADRENLLRDTRIYASALARVLDAPVHPFDYRRTVDSIVGYLRTYAEQAKGRLDLSPALEEANALREELDEFYGRVEEGYEMPATDPAVRRINERQRLLARTLIPVLYTRHGRFRHDPALDAPPLPDLEPTARLGEVGEETPQYHLLRTHLLRGRNRIAWTLREAQRAVRTW